ncbi:MAG: S41 family peptidase [Parvularculaceae bacterium]
MKPVTAALVASAGLALALTSGCTTVTTVTADAPDGGAPHLPARIGAAASSLPPFDGLTPAMAGIWRSNGYGYLAVINGEDAIFYHVTDDFCLGFAEDEEGLFESIDRAGVSADGAKLTLGASPEPHTYEFLRIEEIPPRCKSSPDDTFAGVFNAFVSYMSAHYAFFDVYGVDWPARMAQARARLADISSDTELFDLFETMLQGIDDGHLALAAEIDGEIREFDPGEAQPYLDAIEAGAAQGLSPREAKRAFDHAVWVDGVDKTILGGDGKSAGKGWIKYGLADDKVGYFGTFTSGGFAAQDFSDPLGDLAVLEAALDDALALFVAADVRAVIIDASMNHGGHDFISRAIAARFAAGPVFAYSKFAADASDPYRTDVELAPAQGQRFTGPVYFLTSNITVSAAEILTLTMRALPNVTHAGGVTRGAFSDILEKPLPNGWLLMLSNEVYADNHGSAFEGSGAPPVLPITVFAGDDPAAAHAAAIRALIEQSREPK